MALNSLGLGISVDTTGNAASGFGNIGAAFGKFSSMLPPGIARFDGLISKFGPLIAGVMGTVFALGKLYSFLDKATEKAGQFEYKMAEVSTLLEQDQMKLMPKLGNMVLDLSAKYGKATDDMSKATYQAISAGVNAKEAGQFLGIAGKLAIGGITDMETAVDGLTSIKNAFGLSMNDMVDVSDKMFVAMKAGKTDINLLSKSIGQVAPIASQMKIKLKDVLSMTAALTKGGITTSEAVTGIRQAMVEVLRSTPKMTKAFAKYGVKTFESQRATMSFGKWLAYASKRVTEGGGKMTELFRSVEGLKAALVLSGTGLKDYEQIMKSMNKSTGQTEMAFKKMSKTYQFEVKKMEQAKERFFITVGRDMLPVKKGFVEFKRETYTGMTGFYARWKKNIGDPISDIFYPVIKIGQAFGKVFGNIGTTLRPANDAMGKMWRTTKAVFGLFEGDGLMSSAVRGVGDAIVWVTTRVAVFLKSLLPLVQSISETIIHVVSLIPEAIAKVYEKMSRVIIAITYRASRIALGAMKPYYAIMERIGKMPKGSYESDIAKLQRGRRQKLTDVGYGTEAIRVMFGEAMKKSIEKGLEANDERREKLGKDKKTPIKISNVVNIGNKKLHDSQADWELEFLMRNFIPVY